MIRTALIAALALSSAPALASDPSTVSLTFAPDAATGVIMVALFDAATYDGGAPVRVARIDVAAGDRTATFESLPDGDYAIRAFQDLNGNGRMDSNPFGMPTEPYGFSNNARGNMGPASWDRARFSVSGDTAQTINLH